MGNNPAALPVRSTRGSGGKRAAVGEMTLPDRIYLDPDQAAFVVGSALVECARALRRRQIPNPGMKRILGLLRQARRRPLTEEDVSSILGIGPTALDNDFLKKFDQQFRGNSFRFNLGNILISTPNMALAVVHATRFAVRPRKAAPKAQTRPRTREPLLSTSLADWQDQDSETDLAQDSAAHLDAMALEVSEAADVRKPVRAERLLHGLEAWIDAAHTNEWFDDLVNEPEADDGGGAPEYLIADDLADGAALTEDGQTPPLKQTTAKKRTPVKPGNSPRVGLQEWLSLLGHDHSGVRIEAFAEELVGLMETSDATRLLNLTKKGNDLKALREIEASLLGLNVRPNAALHLRRLVAVHQCLQSGIRLPAKRQTPSYVPVKGRIFYLIHMRDPWEINGYVSRTHLILASMRAGGTKPIALTRLGFPNDLARHRNAVIPDIETVEGVEMMSMPDPRNGQLGRPLNSYIDAYAERVVELAKKYKPAAIHAASNYMNGLAAITAGRKLGIPSVYEVRGIWEITQASANDKYSKTLRYAVQRRLENLAVQSADRVITISSPLQQFVIEHGAKSANVSIVPNGVDASQFRPAPPNPEVMKRLGLSSGDVVIGYVGSIVRYEGLDYVIHALRMLRDAGVRGFRFLVVGDGAELVALKKLALELEVSKLCIFAGRVARSEVEPLYSVVDIVPLPRRSLPVTELVPPLKPFEAMASGKAVIVSSVAALADTVIHEQTGLVVEKDNIDALANALRRLIEDAELRKFLGANSRDWVERERSVSALSKQLMKVYESVGAYAG
jgi:glycosyltransferase involved in cell wall biosynthesis